MGAQQSGAVPGLCDRPVLALDPGMHTAPIKRAEVDAAGRIAVTGSDDKTVRVWSVAESRLLRTIRKPTGPGNLGKIYVVALSPEGGTIAAGGWTCNDPQEQIYFFDAETGEMTGPLDGLPNVVHDLAFVPDGTRLAAVLGGGNGLRLYAPGVDGSSTELARHTAYGEDMYGVAFTADSTRLATASDDGQFSLYDRDGGRLRAVEIAPDVRYGSPSTR